MEATHVNECTIMGQAAGTAEAIAAKGNLGVRDVEISELRKKLAEQEAFLKDSIDLLRYASLSEKKRGRAFHAIQGF